MYRRGNLSSLTSLLNIPQSSLPKPRVFAGTLFRRSFSQPSFSDSFLKEHLKNIRFLMEYNQNTFSHSGIPQDQHAQVAKLFADHNFNLIYSKPLFLKLLKGLFVFEKDTDVQEKIRELNLCSLKLAQAQQEHRREMARENLRHTAGTPPQYIFGIDSLFRQYDNRLYLAEAKASQLSLEAHQLETFLNHSLVSRYNFDQRFPGERKRMLLSTIDSEGVISEYKGNVSFDDYKLQMMEIEVSLDLKHLDKDSKAGSQRKMG